MHLRGIFILCLFYPWLAIAEVDCYCKCNAQSDSSSLCGKLNSIEEKLSSIEARLEARDKRQNVTVPPKKNVAKESSKSAKERLYVNNLKHQQILESNLSEIGSTQEEKDSYGHALSLLKIKKLDEAAAQFETLLQNFPNGKTAGLAYYWLGDISCAKKEYRQASVYFLKSYKVEKNGPKTSKALLRLVDSLRRIEQYDHACAVLQKIEKEFSGDSEVISDLKQEKEALLGLCV